MEETVSGVGTREIAGAIVRMLVRYVRRAAGDDGVARTLAIAGETRPLEVLEDAAEWHQRDHVAALIDAAEEVCGDPGLGWRVGEEMFRETFDSGTADLLKLTGSPSAAISAAAQFGARMSTSRMLEAVERDERHVVIEARTSEQLSRHFYCGFALGFYTQVPSLFGAVGVGVEPECELRGDPLCRWVISWDVAFDVDHEIADVSAKGHAETVVDRFEELQEMASELVRAEDVATALERIVSRAGTALSAPRFLLAVRTGDHDDLRVHHVGFDPREADRHAARLLEGDDCTDLGTVVAVDVASARHRYGRVAAFYPPNTVTHEVDRRLLAAYAGHAAAALEAAATLEGARRDRDTARALLDLAGALAKVGTAPEVAHRLAGAVPSVAGCDLATVWLWNTDTEVLEQWGSSSADEPATGVQDSIRRGETAALEVLLADPSPMLIALEDADPRLRERMGERNRAELAVVPIAARGDFLGAVVASFTEPVASESRGLLLERLAGLAGQAANALDNARLLEHVHHQAKHDSVTGLPNRTLVEERATIALRQAGVGGRGVTVLFVDLDRFKNVNDTLGHRAGDELIRQVGLRLAESVRAGDTLARLGGDEFVVLLPDTRSSDDGVAVAEKIGVALRRPFLIDGTEIYISSSIGIASSPDHGCDYGTLMQHADAAMYEAKARGRNTWALHAGLAEGDRRESLELESDLHRAIEAGELVLLYQPQVDLATMRVVGVEALVRWDHPTLGRLAPDAFLPLAEETGLIVAIDRWVRDTAFRQARTWLDQGLRVRMAVNLSTRELGNPDLAGEIADVLEQIGLPPELVELEVTDRVVIAEDALPRIVSRLKAIGVRVAIDDFGAGNSVISRLRSCPADTLKVDRGLVSEIAAPSGEAPVVTAILTMAHSLGMEVVAEGVETAVQEVALRQQGCELAQGFLLSRPLPADDVERYMRDVGVTPH